MRKKTNDNREPAELVIHPSAKLTPRLLLLSLLQDVDRLENVVVSYKTKGAFIGVVESSMKNSDLCAHGLAVFTRAQDSLF